MAQSIQEGKRVPGYKAQVLSYCEANGIEVPSRFRLLHTSKYVLLLDSGSIHAVTYDYDQQVIDAILVLEISNYHILNFKNCHSYRYLGGKKLIKGEEFDGFVQYYKFNT